MQWRSWVLKGLHFVMCHARENDDNHDGNGDDHEDNVRNFIHDDDVNS